MKILPHLSHARTGRAANRQRGIAAIEFAFVFMGLFLVVYGIATFGAVFYTQQVVSRAAEDGARAVRMLLAPPVAVDDSRIKATVFDSLTAALVVPASVPSKYDWIAANATVTVVLSGGGAGTPNTTAVVTVRYPYSANRLLPTMPLLDGSRWVPDILQSRATAAIPS